MFNYPISTYPISFFLSRPGSYGHHPRPADASRTGLCVTPFNGIPVLIFAHNFGAYVGGGDFRNCRDNSKST